MGIKRVIQNPTMVRENDFETPSATRQYAIGQQIVVTDAGTTGSPSSAAPYVAVYEYCQAGEALAQYGVYAIKSTASGVVAGLNTSSVTSAGYFRAIVPQTAVTAGSYFFGAVKGVCTTAHTAGAGVNMTAGNQFRLANAATTLTAGTVSQAAGTTPTLIRQVNSIGFASGLSGTSAQISVYLYGDAVINNQPTTLL
jgi:hypothetical protein